MDIANNRGLRDLTLVSYSHNIYSVEINTCWPLSCKNHASRIRRMRKINLLLIDSSEIFCAGLAKLLQSEQNFNVVSACSTLSEAVEAARVHKPDVMLIDVESSEDSDIQLIRCIQQIVPDIRIIVLTHSKVGTDFFSAIMMGATGYISKYSSFENLVRAVALAAEGGLVIDPPLTPLVVQALQALDEHKHLAKPEHINLLTKQEKSALALMARGATNKEIASTLFISENTVKAHVRSIMQKSHAHDRLEATICAIEEDLLHSVDRTATQQM